jgi:hypothetical protein
MGCSILIEEFRDGRGQRQKKRNGRGVKTHMTDDTTKREYLDEREMSGLTKRLIS